MISNDIKSLLHEVKVTCDNRDLGGFGRTITKALTRRAIHELADNTDFWPSVSRLISTVNVEHDAAVLLALAELGRLSTTLKSNGAPVEKIAATLLGKRVPPHLSFGDGDQRHYAAIAWERSKFPVDPSIAARTAVLEEASDKARRTWLRLLLGHRRVSDVIRDVTVATRELQWLRLPGADRPFDTAKERARRIALLLKALRAELDADRVDVDDEVVAALSDFVSAAFAYATRSERYADTAKAAEEYILLVLHTIRIKFRLLTEPEIYATVVNTKRWLPDGGWRRITSGSAIVRRLRGTLAEGLVLLLKQGKVSRELADVHRQLSATAHQATMELAAIAAEERDLAPRMRAWLETGETSVDDEEDEDISDTDDAAIAMALLTAYDLTAPRVLGLPSDTELRNALQPEIIESVRGFATQAEELKSRVLSIAKRRSLSVFGEIDTLVDFSPHAHRSIGDGHASKVRVIRRGVEVNADRGSRVIIRAIVS